MKENSNSIMTTNYIVENHSFKKLFLSRAKLKQSSQVSALLSGFALVAMVEMDIKAENPPPFGLLLCFIIVTTLLVSVHMLALMISTCILPHIDAVASGVDVEKCNPAESPHEKMRHYTSVAWAFSTVVGIFLFLLELAMIVWVKFYDIHAPWIALASTIMLVPVIVAFVFFAFHFYRQLVAYKFERSEKGLQELEVLAEQIQDDEVKITFNTQANIRNALEDVQRMADTNFKPAISTHTLNHNPSFHSNHFLQSDSC